MLLLNQHRQAWLALLGQSAIFRGTVARFGHKHRQGAKIQRGATLMLLKVHRLYSGQVIDHIWVDYTPQLAVLGEELRPGALVQFQATVTTYQKGGKNAQDYAGVVFDDLKLVKLRQIQVMKRPKWTVDYPILMGSELTQFAIRTHHVVKSGVKLPSLTTHDTTVRYVGQRFANQLAKTLSWRWTNQLPSRYQFKG